MFDWVEFCLNSAFEISSEYKVAKRPEYSTVRIKVCRLNGMINGGSP